MTSVVVDVERIVCEVPFTERQALITEREVYTWNVVEVCKVTLSSGEVGWGETVLSVATCTLLLRIRVSSTSISALTCLCIHVVPGHAQIGLVCTFVVLTIAGTTHRLGLWATRQ